MERCRFEDKAHALIERRSQMSVRPLLERLNRRRCLRQSNHLATQHHQAQPKINKIQQTSRRLTHTIYASHINQQQHLTCAATTVYSTTKLRAAEPWSSAFLSQEWRPVTALFGHGQHPSQAPSETRLAPGSGFCLQSWPLADGQWAFRAVLIAGPVHSEPGR